MNSELEITLVSCKKIIDKRLKYLNERYKNNINQFDIDINKLLNKYNSNKYKNIHKYKDILPCKLLHLLFIYSKNFGRKPTRYEYNKYNCGYTDYMYIINNYVFEYTLYFTINVYKL